MTPVRFDAARAHRFRSRETFVKTAILLLPSGTGPVTIRAPFGEQQMRGPFYVVGGDDGSYGAAQAEFEQAHRQVGAHQWLRSEPVLAYQADRRCTVVTTIDEQPESTVVADPGDWIVQQPTGEVMAIKPAAFVARYAPELGD